MRPRIQILDLAHFMFVLSSGGLPSAAYNVRRLAMVAELGGVVEKGLMCDDGVSSSVGSGGGKEGKG